MSQHNNFNRCSLFKPLSKRGDGQGMPVVALIFLILCVISLILAGVLIHKVWKAVLGTEASEQDVQILAKAIGEMLDNDKLYDQRVVYLRLEDHTIIGFGPNEPVINQFAPDPLKDEKYNIAQPEECADKGCICRLNGAEPVDCVNLVYSKTDAETKQERIRTVALASLYQAYTDAAYAPPSKTEFSVGPMTLGRAFVIPGNQYTVFAANIHYTDIEQSGPGGKNEDTKAQTTKSVLPVIVEKIIHPDDAQRVYIIIQPVTASARTRWYYYEQCTNKDEPCKGKTPHWSQYYFKQNREDRYCEPSSSGQCSVVDMKQCGRGEVYEPCLCNGLVVLYGFCYGDTYNPTQCIEDITECSDYCNTNLGAAAGDACQEEELVLCQQNPCKDHIRVTCEVVQKDGAKRCEQSEREQTLEDLKMISDATPPGG
jgi:hypothetical protein